MSLTLYLDDCAFSHRLRSLLIEAGHDVAVPGDAVPSLTGADDDAHFAHARETGRTLLTYNPKDFKRLHDHYPAHAGILAVYQDNDLTRDMSYRDVVRAITNLEQAAVPFAGQFWVLNAFRW